VSAPYVALATLADVEVQRRQATAHDGVVLVCASTLKPEPIAWLWRDWLALGKLHILAGAPGQGKTTIAIAVASTLSSGGRWPDGTRCSPANVLIWSGEDDPADTLLPRLLAMGADVSRIYFVDGTRIDGKVQSFDPARDLVQLTVEAERIGSVALLIVDPVVSAVAGDSHKNSEVRRALQPLVDLGATLGAAVLGISHFSKGSAGRDPTERVTGSLAFGAVARVVLCVAKVKDKDGGDDRRILARAKSNIGPDDGGFEYGIAQTELTAHPGITASLIEWGDAVHGTARELLAEAETEPDDSEESTALDDAVEFLRSELRDGPKPAKAIFGEARQAGHSDRTIKRAKAVLKAEAIKEATRWVWALPASEAKGAKEAKEFTSENLGTLGPLGTLANESEAF
jgi:putative DNA primase/helicase